jgi:hypothetical protein
MITYRWRNSVEATKPKVKKAVKRLKVGGKRGNLTPFSSPSGRTFRVNPSPSTERGLGGEVKNPL